MGPTTSGTVLLALRKCAVAFGGLVAVSADAFGPAVYDPLAHKNGALVLPFRHFVGFPAGSVGITHSAPSANATFPFVRLSKLEWPSTADHSAVDDPLSLPDLLIAWPTVMHDDATIHLPKDWVRVNAEGSIPAATQRMKAQDRDTPSARSVDREHFPAVDAQFVARCLNGEEAACTALYHRHYAELMPICMRYARDRDEAKDILQDGFMRIFGSLASYTGKGHFIGWLKRVMVNTAINHYRSAAMERTSLRMDDLHGVGSDPGSVDKDGVISKLTTEELLSLVQALTPAYRLVFNLRVIEGWTHGEIARELGISTGASKSNLNRARMKLMEQVIALYPDDVMKKRTDAP